ncbi:zinc finger protein 91-like isoform X2 [Anthonomus grandis grandis]|uniref:zinc finger protein 91-like isoform X2 n=1 Tax=Anthonomus grandis grandis TaxID=2921223 RepID=UPI0021669C2E|nr:zinc finger protein 91-like isoform X2 [Anthonomus grandis grandis]
MDASLSLDNNGKVKTIPKYKCKAFQVVGNESSQKELDENSDPHNSHNDFMTDELEATSDEYPDNIWDESEISNISDLSLSNEHFIESSDESIPTDNESLEPTRSKIPDGILELFDYTRENSRCLVVNKDITEQEMKDLVDSGINVIHMSTDLNKKKKVIYIGRDLVQCIRQCPHCCITFFSMAEAEDHELKHKKGKVKLDENIIGADIIRCPQCPAEFVFQTDFTIHSYHVHKESNLFTCNRCNQTFKNYNEFQRHYTVKGSSCLLICSKCGKRFQNVSLYENHVAMSEISETCDLAKCKECGKLMARAILDEHVNTFHATSNSALCSECGKSFPSAKTLLKHEWFVHSKNLGTPCPKCNKRFPKANLTVHLNKEHGVPMYICDQCPQMYKFKGHLKKHVDRQHKQKKVKIDSFLTCDKCGLMFKNNKCLQYHTRNIHEGIKEFSCDLCGERFARTDYLYRHKKYHDLYMQNVCDICKTSFRTSWFLKSHMLNGHDEDGQPLKKMKIRHRPRDISDEQSKKSYKNARSKTPKACPICHKVLANASSLQVHYRGHLKLYDKKCPKCDTYFSSVRAVNKHLRLHDDPRFDFRCQLCHVFRDSKEDLEVHMKMNHKNLKYQCHICHERFGKKYILTNHILVKHPEEHEKRLEVFSKLVDQTPEDVPIETYKAHRRLRDKSTFTEKTVHKFVNKWTTNNKQLCDSSEEEQEEELEDGQNLT